MNLFCESNSATVTFVLKKSKCVFKKPMKKKKFVTFFHKSKKEKIFVRDLGVVLQLKMCTDMKYVFNFF